jgi:tetratricopeptide (TPR) repeat protein
LAFHCSTSPADPPPNADAPPEAFQYFEAARAAFKANDYGKSLHEVDHSIKLLPSDARMHDFRALVLFAQGKYHEAAESIYAVLSMGPGWTWDTLMSLYPNEQIYTRQLRSLEAYCSKNPNASDGRFLLGYHYLVMNHIPEGVNQLQHFAELVPQDKLAPQLIKAFSAPPNSQATAELPAQPTKGEPQP